MLDEPNFGLPGCGGVASGAGNYVGRFSVAERAGEGLLRIEFGHAPGI